RQLCAAAAPRTVRRHRAVARAPGRAGHERLRRPGSGHARAQAAPRGIDRLVAGRRPRARARRVVRDALLQGLPRLGAAAAARGGLAEELDRDGANRAVHFLRRDVDVLRRRVTAAGDGTAEVRVVRDVLHGVEPGGGVGHYLVFGLDDERHRLARRTDDPLELSFDALLPFLELAIDRPGLGLLAGDDAARHVGGR